MADLGLCELLAAGMVRKLLVMGQPDTADMTASELPAQVESLKARLADAEDLHRAVVEAMNEGAAILTDLSDMLAAIETKMRLAAVLENSSDAIIAQDLECHITVWNAGAEHIYGYMSGEAVGRHVNFLAAPEGRRELDELLDAVRRGERVENRFAKHVVKSGDNIMVSMTISPILNAAGDLTGFSMIARDVTAQQLGVGFAPGSAEHKQAQEALRLSEERFKEAFSYAPIGITLTDLQGHFLYVNEAYCKIVGMPQDELIRRKMAFMDFMHPDDIAENKEQIKQLVEGKIRAFFLEKRVRRDGAIVWVRTSTSLRRDENGRPMQMVALVEDITERKAVEERLKSTADELARSNRELQEFAYVVSHDLQEPLRQIVGFSDLLERKYHDRLDANATEFIDFIVEGGKRMQALIHDLLSYSRVGLGGGKRTVVSFQEILDKALFNLQLTVDETRARITHDPLPTLVVDEPLFVQVFQNLIGNALKFRGDDPPLIHVGARHVERHWQFYVRDNGIGFKQEMADKIFQVFLRLHGRQAYEGTGIGLAIVKRVVEQHGGLVWAQSEPGKGSAFYFTVPDQGAEQAEQPQRNNK